MYGVRVWNWTLNDEWTTHAVHACASGVSNRSFCLSMRTSVIDFFGSCSESLIQAILGPDFPLKSNENTNLTAYKLKRSLTSQPLHKERKGLVN